MTFPTVPVDTNDLDADTDSPLAARQDLLDLVQKFNQLIQHVAPFAATLLDDVDQATMLATLGITPSTDEIGFMRVWPGLVLPSAKYDWCDGGTFLRASFPTLQNILMKSATATISIATPAVIHLVGHGLRANMPVRFFTTGALPTGITAGTHGGPTAGTQYFVKAVDADNFNIAATPGGANINTTGTQSGVHTVVCAPHGDGDGSTTCHRPDVRGIVPAGRDDMGGSAANRITSGNSGVLGNVPGRSGGAETVTLSVAQGPAHTHSDYYQITSITGTGNAAFFIATPKNGGPGIICVTAIGESAGGTTTGSSGSGSQILNLQPTIIEDWIIRVSP